MFIISDPTGKTPFRHRTEDIETAADIVLGITGEDLDYEVARSIMESMSNDDHYADDRYSITCIDEEELEDCCASDFLPIAENIIVTMNEMCDKYPRLMEKVYKMIGANLQNKRSCLK